MCSRVLHLPTRCLNKFAFNREILSIRHQQVIYFSNEKIPSVFSYIDHHSLKDSISARKDILQRKLNDLVDWYERFTGLDEVRLAQQRVLDAQDSFIAAQERRRENHRQLTALQNRLKDIHSEIQRTSRGEERYLEIVTEEHKVIREEHEQETIFRDLEKQEREYFTTLSNAVKTSHEKERLQADKTKYWSLIASVIGTIIGIIGTTINNSFKMREIRDLVKQSSAQAQHLLVSTLNDTQTRPTIPNTPQITNNVITSHLDRIERDVTKLLQLQDSTVNKILVSHQDQEVSFEKSLSTASENHAKYFIGGVAIGMVVLLITSWR